MLYIILNRLFAKFFEVLKINNLCIPESFNSNIPHQLFDCIITFENSQLEKANSKGDFVVQNLVLNVNFNYFWYTKKKSESKIYI